MNPHRLLTALHFWRPATAALSAALIATSGACEAQALTPLVPPVGEQPAPPWRVIGLPRSNKPLSQFDVIGLDGAQVLRVRADRSYANLVHELPALTLGANATLRWRWRVDEGIALADLSRKSGDDNAIKVCALFEIPLNQLGLIERNLMRLARSVSKEFLPDATLYYVWDNHLAVGTILANPFTHRVRYLVVNAGNGPWKQWITHERHLAEDFLLAFGDESGATLPPLMGILVGADADNTQSSSLAYLRDLILSTGQ